MVTFIAVSAGFVAVNGDGRAQAVPPPNDDFTSAHPVVLGFSPPGGGYEDTVHTGGATLEEGEPTCVPDGDASVWYVYVSSVTSDLVVDTSGSDFATFVSVYRLTNFYPSPPGGSLDEIACSGGAGSQAQLEFTARSMQGVYAIQVGGVGGETGRLRLRVACKLGGCPPGNDEIAVAPVLSHLPFLENGIDTLAARTEEGEPSPCGNIGKTIWYRLPTFETGEDTVSVTATSGQFTTVTAVYEIDYTISPSPLGALREVACKYAPDEDFPTLAFITKPFTTYYVQFGGASGAGGLMSVLISCQPGQGASPCFFGSIVIDTGGGIQGDPIPTGASGGVTLPDAGSGGYLPGAR